ncbi:receptor-type tyrosine-protein phosphatase N2-like [Clavelina lepadiformis]|uniref:receptor-type tyrosine-protein phosphatase N2-like n=1 Tax=Clavelina lepadiformis TaxID=159417 RepID=UPI004041E3BF
MFCTNLIIVLCASVIGYHQSNAIRKYGCLIEPELCAPPSQHCVDDGFIGDCVQNFYPGNGYKSNIIGFKTHTKSNAQPYPFLQPKSYKHLLGLVHEVQVYLKTKKLTFSEFTNSELDQLATKMARLFIKQEKALKQARIHRFVNLISKANSNLEKHGISINQLNDRELKMLSDAIAERFLKEEDQKESEPYQSHASVDSLLKNDKTAAKYNVRNDPPPVLKSDPLAPKSRKKSDQVNSTTSDPPHQTRHQAVPPRNLGISNDDENPSKIKMFKKAGLEIPLSPQDPSGNEKAASAVTGTGPTGQDALNLNGSPANNVKISGSSKVGHVLYQETTFIVVIAVVVVLVVCIVVVSVAIYCMKSGKAREKLLGVSSEQSDDDYQELCRQHYASKSNESAGVVDPLLQKSKESTSAGSSCLSPWFEEPVTDTLDISTSHTILSYMEDQLRNKDGLDKDWEVLCTYVADDVTTDVAMNNGAKNRSKYAVPFDHNRVKLSASNNPMEGDYVNASYIIDNNPRWPSFIATQGPLSSTIHHFWQMVWEQGVVAIVMLTPLAEEGIAQCARYWPDEGSTVYSNYEIHLVSEHIWCEDYLVRNLYLKDLISREVRTITQFHFLSWPLDGVPSSPKPLLDLRRKVGKCFRSIGHPPVVVHCSDGCGRTGSYILFDLVINRLIKGTSKEIDMEATLEHLRDQRAGGMVATKEQFKFSLTCVAEEVNAILRTLSR